MRSTQYHPFPNTHWSLVRRAGGAVSGRSDDDAEAQRQALAILLDRYEPALRSYLKIIRGIPAPDADDILQAFIADQLLEHQLIARADRTRGRFRTLLLTSLNNFAATKMRSARTRLRSAVSLTEDMEHPSRAPSPASAVETAWAKALVHDVLVAMRQECLRTERMDVWTVFEGRVLAEIFGGTLNAASAITNVVSYETLAQQLNLESPTQAANLLITAKRTYARLLRAAVAEYEFDPESIDAEITELREILARSGSLGGDADDPQPRAAGQNQPLH